MFGLKINRNLELPLTRQLCDQFRDIIENKILKSGERLPSTRQIARELKISRNVMIEVYEQLIAEGYLDSKVGSGTYVSENVIKNEYIHRKDHNRIIRKPDKNNDVNNKDIICFASGIPDLKKFPRKSWSKYLKMAVEDSPEDLFDYGDIMGDSGLKKTLSDYVFRVKGINCSPDQIVIVSGSAEGFMLIAKVFSSKYNSVYVEEPTVNFIKTIFNNLDYQIKPTIVDQNGMDISKIEDSSEAKLILLTPSHQFPTGSILPVQRREKAIKIAETTNSYIIEDDYDSEFRLKGVPIPPLQTLNPSRVIYVSTFSKNMCPGLRLGYLIIPEVLKDIFLEIKTALYIRTSTIKQRAMANFIKDGHLERQIYQMKKEYKKKRSLITSLLNDCFDNDIIIKGDETGMHLQVEFLKNKYNNIKWNNAEQFGVKVNSFEEYSLIKGKYNNKIVLGYGNLNSSQIEEGIRRVYKFLNRQV